MGNITGVYFRREDYASLWRRLLVDTIDSLTVGILCFLLMLVLLGFNPFSLVFRVWIAVCFCYFVILKKSKLGTLGYRACGVKIVGQNGRTPGLWSLVIRMMFLVLAPLNYVLDIMWLAGDPHRPALRNKFARTYIVQSLGTSTAPQ